MKKALLILLSLFFASNFIFSQTFVGPEKCMQCHSNMSGWRTSLHANGFSVVLDDSKTMQPLYGVVNDYDDNGIDDFHDGLNFNDISSVFDPFKPNAPILAYSAAAGYTVTIGEVTSRVHLTYGTALFKQRYALKMPSASGALSADLYIGPIQYNDKNHSYALYNAQVWWVYVDGQPTNEPIFTAASTLADIATNKKSISKGCMGCHTTGFVVNPKDANGEWTMTGGAIDPATVGMYTDNNIYDFDGDGVKEQMNTGCESCHGAGSDHASTPTKDNIINPLTDLTAEQGNNLCGMCHNRGKSKPNNTFSYPYDDANMQGWAIGDMVTDYFTDGGGYYGDKVSDGPKSSKKHRQQFLDFYQSSKPTFQYKNVTCFDCHDVHNDNKHHMRREIVEDDSTGAELIIATDNDNNTLCLACHATHGDFEAITKEMVADYDNNVTGIGEIVSAHTNHSYDPENGPSRCSKCHNPKTIKSALPYDIHSHTFEAIPPQKTNEFAMPNSCSVSCHRSIENSATPMFNTGVDASLTDWSEASDVALATKLMEYYGPDGSWWNHTVSVERISNNIPSEFVLGQNYPNPFNPTTSIDFSITQQSDVNITVYNAVGQAVEVLVNDNVPAGTYKINWNASRFASGVYFYRMDAGEFVKTQKMILLK
ncbi:MAG: T9SS type A sorting domain-containing protein [Melioribacteraceae bacterium]|nr:T9SS type A sorting domain-containing protein [Melioribacteraceae bacterium]